MMRDMMTDLREATDTGAMSDDCMQGWHDKYMQKAQNDYRRSNGKTVVSDLKANPNAEKIATTAVDWSIGYRESALGVVSNSPHSHAHVDSPSLLFPPSFFYFIFYTRTSNHGSRREASYSYFPRRISQGV